MNTKITALVITLNEEDNIDDLIKNLTFTDEIIFVDSFSTDATLEKIKQYNHVKVFQHEFIDFSSQRNIALEYASNDWILFIDADERISEDLKKEILEIVSSKDTKDGYYFKRRFYFLGKPMHFSGLRTDKNLRLFKKKNAKYKGLVHEKLNIKNTATLNNFLSHYSYCSYEHFKDKILYYNELKAKEKLSNGFKPSKIMRIFHPTYTFLNRYILRLGILDGKRGYVICKIYSDGIKERYAVMEKIKKEQSV
nr:glycosyltransferase family 2 protein [uncultured Flavobacterium sp.]